MVVILLQEADELILKLRTNYENQLKKVNELSTSLAAIPKLIYGVQEICDLLCKKRFNFTNKNNIKRFMKRFWKKKNTTTH